MDANTPLWKAHDVSQQLQDKIEVLPNVERAFVHVDYETTHQPVGRPCQHPLCFAYSVVGASKGSKSGDIIPNSAQHSSRCRSRYDHL